MSGQSFYRLFNIFIDFFSALTSLFVSFSSPSFLISLFFLNVSLFSFSQVWAKDLTSRLGIGFRNSFSLDLPSLSAQYYPTPDYGVIGSLGIDTEDQSSKFAVSVGIRKIIFKEENLNFFMGSSITMLNRESIPSGQTTSTTESGFELTALVGTEFFLSGLENLGWNLETGVGVTNMKKVRFRTVADHILRAGIIFYF